MEANFLSCLAFTLRYEGGKADDPRDPGGRTNQGVTQRTFAAWLRTRGQPSRDVFAMAPAERDAIYRTGYWDAVGGDRCSDGVDLALFDFAVNSGPSRALKAYGGASGDAASAVRSLCARRLSLLHALRTFGVFGRGWTARVVACEALGVKMAEQARIGLPANAPAPPQIASKLQAESRAAHDRATKARTAGGTIAATGAAAHPAAMAAAPLPWAVIAVSAICVALLCAVLLWKAHEARLRAAAYAALAAS